MGNAAGSAINACLCHALFSLCSFLVLGYISPAQHSIANVCKRLFMIGVAATVLTTAVTPGQIFGACITAAGVVWFFLLPPPIGPEDSLCAHLPPALASCAARASNAAQRALHSWSTVLLLHAAAVLLVYLQHGAVM
jgi:drug/metabolite transporter (DMT)-like permease